jgi:uncharacterized OB-fold protein
MTMNKKDKIWPGTAIHEEDLKTNKVLFTEWKPNLKYAWDAGIGYGKYFSALKEGKIIGTKCNKCRRVLLPARVFCEICFRTVDDWIQLKDTGVVNTFSIAYTDTMANRIKEPKLPALIEIDGSGGVAIMHLLGEVDPKKIKIGMKVKAVWKPEQQREGAITDIKYWKPI